jgi:WD40 repeat protein
MWDASTGGAELIFEGHTGIVSALAFSPTEDRIATVNDGYSVTVWDAITGAEVLTLKRHTSFVNAVSFSADGTRIVTASHDTTAMVWDAMTGDEIRTLKGHAKSVTTALFNADGTRIVTASEDKTAKVWDAMTGAEILTFEGHELPILSAAWSPDDCRIVTCCTRAKVWDAQTGTEEHEFICGGYVEGVAWHPDGRQILTGCQGTREAVIWDAGKGALLSKLHLDSGRGKPAVAWSPDGTRILIGGAHRKTQVLEAKVGATKFDVVKYADWSRVAWSPNGAFVAVRSWLGGLCVHDANSGDILLEEQRTDSIWRVSWNHDSTQLLAEGCNSASMYSDDVATVWDVLTGTDLFKFTLKDVGGSLVWGPSSLLVYKDADGSKFFDAKTGVEVLTLNEHPGTVRIVDWNREGTRLVTAGRWVNFAEVWNAQTGIKLFSLIGHTNSIVSVVWSADGTRILTGSADCTAKVWDAQTGACLLTLKGHGNSVSVGWSPDGSRIFTACEEQGAKVWDARTGVEKAAVYCKSLSVAPRPQAK